MYRQIQFENDEDGKPAGKYRMSYAWYPCVTEDNSIESKSFAPDAKSVSVVLENGTEEPSQIKEKMMVTGKTIGNPAEGFNYVTFMSKWNSCSKTSCGTCRVPDITGL